MSVSFGKIVIVNAPLRTAQTIANRANYRSKTSVGEQIQTIINDTRFGKAHAFPVCGSKEKSYIFSGSEGRKYGNLLMETLYKMDLAHYFLDNEIKIIDTSKTWEHFEEQVEELVSSSKNVSVMNVDYTNLGDIKSVNLIA